MAIKRKSSKKRAKKSRRPKEVSNKHLRLTLKRKGKRLVHGYVLATRKRKSKRPKKRGLSSLWTG